MSRKIGGILVIQYNWEENIRKNENVWVYYKELNEPSCHGYTEDGSFSIVSKTSRSILILHPPKSSQVLFVCPIEKFGNNYNKSVVSLDVAEGGLAVSASVNNKLFVWDAATGEVRRELEGHIFDVNTCRLFPSGVVVLSAGADMQIKIWDATSGTCPVTMKGHTGTVTGTAIIESGKNVISVSKDGTARLWNCARALCIAEIIKVESAINCCDVTHDPRLTDPEEMATPEDELEVATNGKILAIGCEDGKLYLMDVARRSILATHFFTGAILCVSFLASGHAVVGLEDGTIGRVSLSALNELPEILSHDSASGVLCIRPLLTGFIVARKDGICQIFSPLASFSVQLTGPDCDPVYSVATDSKFVYTACRDSFIRKYCIEDFKSIF